MSESEPTGTPPDGESIPPEPARNDEWAAPDASPQGPEDQAAETVPPQPQSQAQTQPQLQSQPEPESQRQPESQPQPQTLPEAQPEPRSADDSPTVLAPTASAAPQPTPAAPYFAPPFPAREQFPGQYQGQPQWQLPSQPGQGMPNPYYTAAYSAPPPPKRNRKRILWISTAVVVVLALAAAGVYALLPGRTGNSVVAKVACRPAALATCLILAPAGAEVFSAAGDPWAHQTEASSDLYQATIAHDSPGVGADGAALLGTDGMRTLVHTDWNAVDGNDVDLVLLQFATQKGAQAWNSTRTAEILAGYGGPAVAIPGDTTAKAHTAAKADAQGNIDAAYSTVVGNIVLNVSYSSPKELSAADLATWAGTELASIRTAPPAAADPADTAAGTENVACSELTSCLVPMPSGAERWTSPTSKLWVKSTTLTQSQFVKLEWQSEESVQQSVSDNFTSDGVTGIVHDDWDTDNADKQADIYLIQTITADAATQLANTNFGEPDWASGITGVSFTIPNEPDAQAWYTDKKGSDGFTQFYFMQVVGNVIVHGWLFFYGSFDSGTATKWAQSELNLVNSSLSSQPIGLFPLTAPTLPAAGRGTCPASGDCLLPLPAGATDTTSSSYYVTEDLGASDFTDQYNGGSSSTDDATWMKSDGFKDAEHRSWTAADGATADTVLLKYGTPAQAQADALLEYGGNAPGERLCTGSALPDAMCLASRVDPGDFLQKETVWVLAWKGDYEVSVSVTASNQADVTDAYTYAQQQLDLLPAG
jgi:hypothetical protein